MSDSNEKLHGIVAYFADTDGLMAAARKVRDAGYKRWDSYTPFPVHGIDDAMGIKPTILPWIVLVMGLTGLSLGILLQWYTNAFDYVFLISGKPDWSLWRTSRWRSRWSSRSARSRPSSGCWR